MSQTPSLILSLSILNLLLSVAGLLFVYFDWNAARRREYLYLYFTEEKPGYDYFAAARRRRVQYTRLLIAFVLLSVRQFLKIVAAASVSQPEAWNQYLRWYNGADITPTIQLAVELYPWIGMFEALGLAWLGFALLYQSHQDRSSLIATLLISAFTILWIVFAGVFAAGAFGAGAYAAAHWTALTTRGILLLILIIFLQSRKKDQLAYGLLNYSPNMLSVGFAAWFVAIVLGVVLQSPAPYPIGLFFGYGLLVSVIAKGTLNEYESMEMSRHRLGRERSVIFSFLKRLGVAFTTEVEVQQILDIILESALETTEASAGAIYLISDEKILEPRVVLNFFPPMYIDSPRAASDRRTEELEDEMKHQSFALGEGVIGEVAQTGRAQLVDDVRAVGIMLGTTTEYMRNRSMLAVPLRIRDEILGVIVVLNKQRSSFGPDDQSLLQTLADQASLSINNAMLTVAVAQQERLRRDLQIARDIQQRLLPEKCPIVPGFEIAALGTSAMEVGGDYYDFFWVDDDHLGIVVADVSGKGVYAALVVAMIRSAFRTQAPGNSDVCDVLSRVNTFISQDLRRDMFITCVYGILEVSTKKFSWARAGHEPLLLAHPDDRMDLISPDGFALGIIEGAEFSDLLEVKTIELHPGDRMLLFTDGLTEAMNKKGEEFGMERVLASLADHPAAPLNSNGAHHIVADKRSVHCASGTGNGDPQAMIHLTEAVTLHVDGAEQSDDLTIVYLAAK